MKINSFSRHKFHCLQLHFSFNWTIEICAKRLTQLLSSKGCQEKRITVIFWCTSQFLVVTFWEIILLSVSWCKTCHFTIQMVKINNGITNKITFFPADVYCYIQLRSLIHHKYFFVKMLEGIRFIMLKKKYSFSYPWNVHSKHKILNWYIISSSNAIFNSSRIKVSKK